MNARKRLNFESRFNVGNDLVDLSHISDAERGENSENRKERRQYFSDGFAAFFAAEPVLQIVHCTAGPFAVCVLSSEVDTKYVFGEVGHHAEKGGNPHPENRSGTARNDGGGNSRNVPNADCCRKGSAQRLKLRNGGLVLGVPRNMFFKHTADGVL